MKNISCIFLLNILLISLSGNSWAQQAATPGLTPWLEPYIEGKANAPVEITEYFTPLSLSSAESFRDYHHGLVDAYVKPGILRIKYQEISTSDASTTLIGFLHCLPKEKYLPTLSAIFSLQLELSRKTANTPEENRLQTSGAISAFLAPYIASTPGLLACMISPAITAWSDQQVEQAHKYFGIRHTPFPVYAFGATPYRLGHHAKAEDFEKVINALANAAQ